MQCYFFRYLFIFLQFGGYIKDIEGKSCEILLEKLNSGIGKTKYKNIQRTTIGNIWKVAQCRKTQKEAIQAH